MGETMFIFLIFVIATVQMSMECQTHEGFAGNRKHLNSHQPKTKMRKHMVDQHLIVLNLYSISINKILTTGFMTMKFSKNLNSVQKMSDTRLNTKHSKTN